MKVARRFQVKDSQVHPPTLSAPVSRLMLAVAFVGWQPDARAGDSIYHGGTILTVDANAGTVAAVAVRDEKILACGTLDHVRSLADRNAATVDLKGRTLLPGFYAAHDHFLNGSVSSLYSVDLNSPAHRSNRVYR